MNILIVRVSSLGDVVHNMPMAADILHPPALAEVEAALASLLGPVLGSTPTTSRLVGDTSS